MLAKVKSFSLNGIEGYAVDIELDINAGIPAYDIVGLPDLSVKESRERVRSAIKNSLFDYPLKRITVNLAPADTKKEGAFFDLAIALGILAATGQISPGSLKEYIILGELSLDGRVRRLHGIMPILIAGLQNGFKKFLIPQENAGEAAYIEGVEVFAISSLAEAVGFLLKEKPLAPVEHRTFDGRMTEKESAVDFSEVKGQAVAKRALEIAVAGGHNVLLIGPPGAGKTMLAKCIPSIMPEMSFEEAIEVTKIHSVAGKLNEKEGIVKMRPYRAPHHTATIQSLTGGGSFSKPGEISLAHNGVLFLDEMPEYSRKVLETLRQPLEDGRVCISRVRQTLEYPADFMLIASMNPCPCGYFGSARASCKCTPNEIRKYVSRLSGPLLDRIDLQVEVDGVSFSELRAETQQENSRTIKTRVEKARAMQKSRFKNLGNHTNAGMANRDVQRYCTIDKNSENLLENAYRRLNLSARAGTRILKVARTIADLAGKETIELAHVAEAIQYRSLDRKYWE